MNTEQPKPDDKGALAILAGSISAIVAAAILLPLFIFGTDMVHFTKEGDDSGDGDLKSLLWKLLWLLLASFIGGLVCCLIAKNKEKFYAACTFIIILLLYILFLGGFSVDSLSNYFTLAGGCFLGWGAAIAIKKRKKK
jgi:uncharacterized membrane protein YeiB